MLKNARDIPLSLDRIEITPFALIVGDLLQNRRTGYLTIIKPPVQTGDSWIYRRSDGKSSAVMLSAAGLTVSSAAAYLGGELVFGRGWMVNHDAWVSGPEDWTPVATEADVVEGAMKAAELAGRHILLYREKGDVNAIEATCSHAAARSAPSRRCLGIRMRATG